MQHQVLITGGSRGIGKATASVLADNGYQTLAPNSHDLDVSSDDSIANYLSSNLNSNNLYGLVCNAGIYYEANIDQHSIEDFQKVLDVNLTGAFRAIKHCLPYLQNSKQARIILIASVSAQGNIRAPGYSASKAGMIALVKSLAPELAHDGITINAINPGWVRTDMAKSLLKSEEDERNNLGTTLLKRWIEPEEVGKLVKYLLSEDASAITGEVMTIDAGLTV